MCDQRRVVVDVLGETARWMAKSCVNNVQDSSVAARAPR